MFGHFDSVCVRLIKATMRECFLVMEQLPVVKLFVALAPREGRLVAVPVKTTHYLYAQACARECLSLPASACLSFNYDYSNTGICELLGHVEGHTVYIREVGLMGHPVCIREVGLMGHPVCIREVGLMGHPVCIREVGLMGHPVCIREVGLMGHTVCIREVGLMGHPVYIREVGLMGHTVCIREVG